jgi:hypothetical protein
MYWSKIKIENYIKNEIQQSIKNDVGISLDAYWEEFSKNNRGVGYFAVPRMIFPELDGLGSFITGKTESTFLNIKTYLQEVMSLVDARYYDFAVFIALIFRHGLLHQHSPKRFKYKNEDIGWNFRINSPNNPMALSRKRHLVFDRSNLIIDMNLFFNDVIESVDLFLPMVTKKYKTNFEKSMRLQYKKLTRNSFLKRKYINKSDFPFLT